MQIAVLGTGTVGQTLGSALIECGHHVVIGSRSATNDAGVQWAVRTGGACATFDEAAATCELVINATAGVASVEVLESIRPDALAGKVIIDVSNPLDFSHGFPPKLSICNTTSLAEELQRVAPNSHVVKTLNTVTAEVMVAPQLLGSDHVLFLAGDAESAKQTTHALLQELGWRAGQLVDLGDLTGARAMEMYLPLWVRLFQTGGSAQFNVSIIRPTS